MTNGITTEQATYRLKQALGTVHTTETWHLNRACNAYAKGQLTIQRLEAAIEHVLRGGYLNENLEPRSPPRSPLLDRVRARRRCETEGHDLIDITQFGDVQPVALCSRCSYRT